MQGVNFSAQLNSKNALMQSSGVNIRCNMMQQPCLVIGGGEDDPHCDDIESVRIDDSDRNMPEKNKKNGVDSMMNYSNPEHMTVKEEDFATYKSSDRPEKRQERRKIKIMNRMNSLNSLNSKNSKPSDTITSGQVSTHQTPKKSQVLGDCSNQDVLLDGKKMLGDKALSDATTLTLNSSPGNADSKFSNNLSLKTKSSLKSFKISHGSERDIYSGDKK